MVIKGRKKIVLLIFLCLIVFIIGAVFILNKEKTTNKDKYNFSGYGLQLKKGDYKINDFTIQVEENGEFDCDIIFTNNSDKKSTFSLMLYLNYDKISFCANNQSSSNEYKFARPNNKIYAEPGQDVDLAIRFGGYSGINNYLIWLNINYEQCLINNSGKYLLIKNQESSLQYKKITFKAPIEKGKYELWAFLQRNPFNFQENSRHSLDYLHRITLIVR